MTTRLREKQQTTDPNAGKSVEWRRVNYMLSMPTSFGRRQLYPFRFSRKDYPNEDTYECAGRSCGTHDTSEEPVTIDHKKPLAKLFKDEWEYSLYYANRREQFHRKSNLQYMCREANSSKGSEGETYDQRMALSCKIFESLEENPNVEEVLVEYGYEQASKQNVLDCVKDVYEQDDT